MAQRPNILVITADQQRGDTFGFEGSKVKTPHLDLMAAEGTVFGACITPNLVCQPARASILSGLLPRTHGVADNGIDLPVTTGEAGFAGQLAATGYCTGYIGKMHFATSHTFEPTGKPECRGSMERYGEDWYGPYMGFEYVEMVVEGHNRWDPAPPPSGQHYERWYYQDGRGDLKNKLFRKNVGPDTLGAPQTWHSGLPVAWHNSTWVGDRTIGYLNTHAEDAKSGNKPFCAWASFPDPHHPFDCPVPWSLLHDPNDIDLPPHRTLDLDKRPWWHRESLEGEPKIREDLAEVRKNYSRIRTLSDDQLRQVIANYYGMISLIDHNVGRIMTELERLGLAENTLVIYATDHGDWLGDHGLLLKGPMPYEGLLRVGCLMKGPGVPQGERCGEPVSTLDIGATALDAAGVAKPHNWHSRSLLPVAQGKEERAYAYSEWDLNESRCGVKLELRTVRTKTHKLTLEMISGAGELYDLVDDKHETTNRFDDPALQNVQKELVDMIMSRPDDAIDAIEPVGMA
ncbi:MAG: sulfatase-like hydrolase/transferase [Pseudomonadota bacterium]